MNEKLKHRRRMLADERLATACHEAAHAVAMFRLGMSFKCVRLCDEFVSGKDYEWVNKLGLKAKRAGVVEPTDERIRRKDFEREAICLMAGLAFEKLLRPYVSYRRLCLFGPPASDYRKAMELVSVALYDDTEHLGLDVHRELFSIVLPPARQLVVENWSDIAAVGELLEVHGELNESEVEGVLMP